MKTKVILFWLIALLITGCSSSPKATPQPQATISIATSAPTPTTAPPTPTRKAFTPTPLPTATPAAENMPAITNGKALANWFTNILKHQQYEKLSEVTQQGVLFANYGIDLMGMPRTPSQEAIKTIEEDTRDGFVCLGYSEGEDYAVILLGNLRREGVHSASFQFEKTPQGYSLDMVVYIPDWALKDGLPEHRCAPEQSTVEARVCGGELPTRLKVGEYAVVNIIPPLPNRVRQGPGKTYAIVGKIEPGDVVKVLDGPVCANGWAWWKIIYHNITGWTAEGDGQSYWLSPCQTISECQQP